MQDAVRAQALDRRDLASPSAALTGTEQDRVGDPVDMDRAGAALGDAAAVFGAGQPERVAQDPKQRGVGIDIDLVRLSVDRETRHPPLLELARHVPLGGSIVRRLVQKDDGRKNSAGPPIARAGKKRRPMRPPLGLFHDIWMLWFFSGNERMRLPVALKNALSTAGAATQIVGSPTPPQNRCRRTA